MEFAWNTQKNKMTDVKGKEYEQDRKGHVSNPDIDPEKMYLSTEKSPIFYSKFPLGEQKIIALQASFLFP